MDTVPQSFAEWVRLLVTTSKAGGFPAVSDESPDCQYRGTNDRKCAAGLLIPDEKYLPEIEGLPADDLLHLMPDWVCDYKHELSHAQSCHDTASHSEWDHAKFVGYLAEDDAFYDELIRLREIRP